jgi:hypothetical protein
MHDRIAKAATEQEKKAAWNAMLAASSRRSTERHADFRQRFVARASVMLSNCDGA